MCASKSREAGYLAAQISSRPDNRLAGAGCFEESSSSDVRHFVSPIALWFSFTGMRFEVAVSLRRRRYRSQPRVAEQSEAHPGKVFVVKTTWMQIFERDCGISGLWLEPFQGMESRHRDPGYASLCSSTLGWDLKRLRRMAISGLYKPAAICLSSIRIPIPWQRESLTTTMPAFL
jgi:hypothetical protein